MRRVPEKGESAATGRKSRTRFGGVVRGETEKRAPDPYGGIPQPQKPHLRRGLGRIRVLPNFTLPLLEVGTVGLQRQGACPQRQQLSPYCLSAVGPRTVGSGRVPADEQRGEMNRAMGLEQKGSRGEETGSREGRTPRDWAVSPVSLSFAKRRPLSIQGKVSPDRPPAPPKPEGPATAGAAPEGGGTGSGR